MDIENKVILITGAARGLGAAMALALSKEKAQLILVDINEAQLNVVKEKCRVAGSPKVVFYTCDVSNEDAVVELFNWVAQSFSQLNGLINNAGIIRDNMLVKSKNGQVISKMTLEEWQKVIDINLTGVFLCAREAAAKMIESNTPGVIINISSISKAGNFGQSNYSAAKAGVAALTVTWAKELAKNNIRVCAIAPGFISTEMTASMPAQVIKNIENQIPLQRMGSSDEIAMTARYIFENDYLTGRVFEIDGGARL